MNTKKRAFNRIVFDELSDTDNYDKISYQLNKIRSIMIEEQVSFGSMSAKQQFDYCVTIYKITMQSIMYDLRLLRSFGKKKDPLPYSIDEGYKPPELISIKELKTT